jgi:hypothetical protein
MKRQNKLTSLHKTEEQQQAAAQQQTQETSAVEFGTVEEMLRHDALHTPVPPNVATRLQKSIGPAAASPAWWRRFFGGPKP